MAVRFSSLPTTSEYFIIAINRIKETENLSENKYETYPPRPLVSSGTARTYDNFRQLIGLPIHIVLQQQCQANPASQLTNMLINFSQYVQYYSCTLLTNYFSAHPYNIGVETNTLQVKLNPTGLTSNKKPQKGQWQYIHNEF